MKFDKSNTKTDRFESIHYKPIVKKINKSSNSGVFVEVSRAYEFNDRIFVIIHEFVASQGKKYTFEFDKNGNIIDWCKSSEYVQLQFE